MGFPDCQQHLAPLPLGDSEFSILRRNGKIYVDKTAMVFELAKSDSRVLLVRPRRFGKSLLVSTFDSLFRYGLRDFEGLAIEKLWKDTGKYLVIRLDFSLVKNFLSAEDFKEQFNAHLMDYLEVNGLLDKHSSSSNGGITEFHKWLGRQLEKSVVLLVDEYDGPLTSCMTDPKRFEEVMEVMEAFYDSLKRNSKVFRFVFLTGIIKFGNSKVISEFNGVVDISSLPEFGSIVGFTKSELKDYFADYLKESAKILNHTEHTLFEKLIAHYTGFCFEPTVTEKVLPPWSILNFFDEPNAGLLNYWFQSGGSPSSLLRDFPKLTVFELLKYLEGIEAEAMALYAPINPNKTNENDLLFQTGYLTIKGRRQGNILYLGYPNLEVANSMARVCLRRLMGGKTLANVNAADIPFFFAESNIKEFVKRMNNAYLALDHSQYFIKDEYTCQAAFLLVLYGSGLQAQVETHNTHGRSDIEFTISGVHWVIELKLARKDEKIRDILKEGEEQIIRRHHGELSGERRLIRLVMVFSQEDRCFIGYELV